MVPAIFQSRNSLLKKIIKLERKIKDLTENFTLVVDWINIKYEIEDIPDNVAQAMQQCREVIEKIDEPALSVFGNEGKAVLQIGHTNLPPTGDSTCRICNKKLKNANVLRAHAREHLPPEVLVPISRPDGDNETFKKRRYAYRCLTCQVIITDRRKYLAHVVKHRKDSKQEKEAVGNEPNDHVRKFRQTEARGPLIKLLDIISLDQSAIVSLEKEHGISNLNSVMEILSTQLNSSIYNNIKMSKEDSAIGDEEEIHLSTLNDQESCDPLLDISPTPNEDEPGNTYEEIQESTDPFSKVSSKCEDITVDCIKEEINDDYTMVKIEKFEEEKDPVNIEDNFFVRASSDHASSSTSENVTSNRRKSRRTLFNEFDADLDADVANGSPKENNNESHGNAHKENPEQPKKKRAWIRKAEKVNVEYSCDKCDAKYQKMASLRSHKEAAHLPPEVILPYYSKQGYRNPLETRHRYRCTFCEAVMTNKDKYIEHVKNHKRGAVKDGPGSCRFCNKIIQNRKVLARHEAAHEKGNFGIDSSILSRRMGKYVNCTVCGQSFTGQRLLDIHMNKHTGNRPYLCSHCGKGFMRKSHLMDHELIHSEVRHFKCDYCEKTFKKRQSKYVHERRHKESFTVICNLCGFSFRGEYNLRRHIEGVHENIRPHQCHLCEKKFKGRGALKYHLKTHDNPNSRQRSVNRYVDPLKASAKRRHVPHHNMVPILSPLPPVPVAI